MPDFLPIICLADFPQLFSFAERTLSLCLTNEIRSLLCSVLYVYACFDLSVWDLNNRKSIESVFRKHQK